MSFIVSQSVIKILKSHACVSADLEIISAAVKCLEDGVYFNPIKTIMAFVTMTAMLTGILAPKLLLHIRKEYYTFNDPSNSRMPAPRSTMLRVAPPSDLQVRQLQVRLLE